MDRESHALRMFRTGLLCGALFVCAPGAAVPAGADFQLQGQVIAGGGTSRAHNVCFGLSATIGEATAGSAAAGGYAVVSGFWAAPIAHPDQMFNSSFEDCQS